MTKPHDADSLATLDGEPVHDVATASAEGDAARPADYVLEEQVGFLIRRAHQRASGIFAGHFKQLGLNPVQFAALTKIADAEPVSQNQLGRLIHMDPATTMAMINRLCERGLVARQPDPGDRRRVLLSIRPAGRALLDQAFRLGAAVTAATLAPLGRGEREQFLSLLAKLG